ncbi:MAG: PASTA domain-containing protein [Chitinophagales bacterium]
MATILGNSLWKHLIAIGLASVIAVWLIFWGMGIYTNHGESITVPDLREMTLEQVKRHLKTKDLRYTILDSTYIRGKLPETVIEQDPKPGAKVKENRRIYLTINSKTPPIVEIPNIIQASLRHAEKQLQSVGLEVGELEYVPYKYKNLVLKIKLNGAEIEPQTKVEKGSAITLVLGNGLGNTRIPVPTLVGLSFLEARIAIQGMSLTVGAVVREDDVRETDSDRAIVYRQIPAPGDGTEITIGEPVDLFLRSPYSQPRETEIIPEYEEEVGDSVEVNPLDGPDN